MNGSKIIRVRAFELSLLVSGLVLMGSFGFLLRSEGRLAHSQNPFALQRSGYGMVLARLSQDTVNKVWHYGVEENAGCGHGHDDGEGHRGPCHGAGRDGELGEELSGVIERGFVSLVNLKLAKFQRTNPYGLSLAHRSKVTADIERILLRSYRMDPTDYGVYNAYELFLSANELRATPAAKEQAKRVAGITVAAAAGEEESPFPWLTAASALMDQFLLDQQRAQERNQPVPRCVIAGYRERIAICLARFRELRGLAVSDQRWEKIGRERTESAEECYRFLERASLQFGAILGRMDRDEAPILVQQEEQ